MSKSVLITGASGGIGKALCDYFSDRGYRVLAHARREDQAYKLTAETPLVPVWGDLTQPDQVAALAEQVKAAGPLDLLVHNAGILTTSTEPGPAGLGIQAEVNVVAPARLTEALADHMAQSDDPQVVLVTSSAANFARSSDYSKLATPDGSSLFGHYALSKCAANTLALQLAETFPQLKVFATEPGFVKTKMTATNSSMPTPMRWAANLIAATPKQAAHRCFDFLLDEKPASGSVIQSGKVVKSDGKKWSTQQAFDSLKGLLSRAGINWS